MMSLKNVIFLFFLIYLSTFFILVLNFKEILSTLILIEFLVLNLFMVLFLTMVIENLLSIILYFFVIVVCEGAMGLSILISMIRLGGNSMFNSSNFSVC